MHVNEHIVLCLSVQTNIEARRLFGKSLLRERGTNRTFDDLQEPEEGADLALFLIGAGGSGMTGRVFTMDPRFSVSDRGASG